jgi:hypothetical protein
MGRGRSKAKQTKVARELKYANQEMDLERLASQLHSELESNKKISADDNYTNDKFSKE